MDFENYRVGNKVNYVGPLNGYQKSVVEIVEIEDINEQSSYLLRVQIAGKKDYEFVRAYQDDITPIITDHEFLLKNGFDFNKETKYYTKEDVTVAHVIFTRPAVNMYGQPDGVMYDDRGHGIIEAKINNPTTEEEILSKVTLLNWAHAFQNYYSAKLGREFY